MKAVCLNLNKRKDRWELAQQEFKKQGLHVQRFAAIEHDNPFYSFNLSQKIILDSIKENTIVFEDDVVFIGDLNETLKDVPEDWDLLYFGGNVTDNLKHHSGNWWRCKKTYTTHAVAYTPKAAKYISERFYPETDTIYDAFLFEEIQDVLNCYICKPFVCVQRNGYSDLWLRDVEYGLEHHVNKLK